MDESRLLISRLDDLIYKSYCGDYEGIGFLNESEISVCHKYLNNLHVPHCFFGGYEGANRSFLYLSEDYSCFSDITILYIKVSDNSTLAHKDYLGAIMGLGITRECVGDIIPYDKGCVVFVRSEIADFIIMNLSSVGRFSAVVEHFNGDITDFAVGFEELEILVSSLRIDNFVSSICNFSRAKADEYINSDKVFINYVCVEKTSKTITESDIVTIRGFGKYIIGTVLRKTKSGRLVLLVNKYK